MDDLTDEQILAKHRQRWPYITLTAAKELEHISAKFRHLGALAQKRKREAAEEERRRLRAKLFGVKE